MHPLYGSPNNEKLLCIQTSMSFQLDKWIERLKEQKRIGLECLKGRNRSELEHAQVHLKQEQVLENWLKWHVPRDSPLYPLRKWDNIAVGRSSEPWKAFSWMVITSVLLGSSLINEQTWNKIAWYYWGSNISNISIKITGKFMKTYSIGV